MQNLRIFVKYCLVMILVGLMHLIGNNCFLTAQSNDIFFERISTEDGLSQLTVSCIYQDSRGFIWFGTQDGLNRYDGYTIEVYKTNPSDEKSISNNQINSISEDSTGNIWIGTERGLNRYDYGSGEFIRFFKGSDTESNISHDKASFVYRDRRGTIWIGTEKGIDCLDQKTLTFHKRTFDNFLFNNRIITIHEDSYGNLWIGTLRGLLKYNRNNDDFEIFKNDTDNSSSISDNHIRSIYEDSRRNLWIGTSNGLNYYDPKNNNFLHFGENIYKDLSLTNNAVRCIVEDSNQNLLIGTNEGLNIFNYETGLIKKYNPTKMIPGNLNHFFIYSLFVDNAETVWIGTYFGGVNYFNLTNHQFKYFNPGNEFVYGSIGKIFQEDSGLWIGTGGGGLLKYDNDFNFQDQYLFESQLSQTNSANIIKSINKGDRSLIISTDNQLLVFDIRQGKIIERLNKTNGSITDIYKTHQGQLFLCVNDTLGLRSFNPKDSKVDVVSYKNEAGKEMLFPFVTCVIEEYPGKFWIGTKYVGLFYYDSNNQTVKRFEENRDTLSLRSNYITALHIDDLNNFWIGTRTGGLSRFDRNTETFFSYGHEDGLPNLEIRGLLEDDAGYIWIATRSGVSRLDPATNEFLNYNKENGFPLQEVSEYSFSRLDDGQIVVGGNNGFTVFDPMKIRSNKFIPPVMITNFRLMNSAEKKNIINIENSKNNINLKSTQSSFIIEYTALNYIFPGKNQYAYKLEGFDTDWNYVGGQRTATFTNLNAGEYVFRVRASNNDGIWNESGKLLYIKVSPAPWKTWWAYSIYLLILSGLFFLVLHYLRLENRIKMKQLEQENSELQHQMHIRMFTNFSHELRTPLTLIISPVEDLINDLNLPGNLRNSLLLIQKNAYRLMGLVNQLMDFRKQESGKVRLKAAKGRYNRFINEISMAFNALAIRQNINFIIEGHEEEIFLWYDRQQLEKVFYNLLSNAFKNTSPNGEITVSISKKSIADLNDLPDSKCNLLINSGVTEFIETRVRNTGMGIPFTELEKIFDPFYQVMEGDIPATVGTGIGLSLVKGITEIHHGIVIAESSPGEWAQFRVILPLGKEHLLPEEIFADYISSEHLDNYMDYETSEVEETKDVPQVQNKKKFTILLIDDNDEIRDYIRQRLIDSYNVLEASNGKEGLSTAIRVLPDLVISDIMMPEIDGLQLCLQLKKDIITSHIPVILLTARTSFLQVKEGFDVGADDYIIKPFNANVLKLKINGVLTNRERLKQALGKKLPFELSESETTSMDEQFLKKVYQVIEKNISNPDFLIEDLSKEIGMSRASLYRKIKALTDFSANEFIKNYRLQVAIKYLRETDLSISEISYRTGFKNPAYFTNCFKKAYKMSPTKYLQNLGTVTSSKDSVNI